MTEMDWPSDALVICTRNRIDDIKRCFASLEAASYLPGRILVVDSSDGRETEEYCAESELPITYIRAPRGLSIQRNVALAEVDEEIVHFIDDDVEVEPDYFREILQVFRDSSDVSGVGGAMAGLGFGGAAAPVGGHRPGLFARLTLQSSVHRGRVLRSGCNTGCYDSPSALNVDWLPGCSMSFRMSAISGLKFAEDRTGPNPGEDVDFGLKALDRGRLVYTPRARLVHHVSSSNRPDPTDWIRAGVRSRWMLAADFPHRVSRGLVIYSSIAQGLWVGGRAVAASILKRNAPTSVRRERAMRRQVALASFAGVIDVLRDGSNVDP